MEETKEGGNSVIGRMYTVSPVDIERFYLRLLLLHVPGATSFEYLRSVDDITYPTFKEAAHQRHLLADDEEWNRALDDGAAVQMPAQLRFLFATICSFCNPNNPRQLWDSYKDTLIEDYQRENEQQTSEFMALQDIEEMLSMHGQSCSSLGLPVPPCPYPPASR